MSGLVVNITVPLSQDYCPSEVIPLSIGGTFFVPEMLPEATENFFKKMKAIGQHGIQRANPQQTLIDQWYVSLRFAIACKINNKIMSFIIQLRYIWHPS